MGQKKDMVCVLVILACAFGAIPAKTEDISPNHRDPFNTTISHSTANDKLPTESELSVRDHNNSSPGAHFEHLVVAAVPISIKDLIEIAVNPFEDVNPLYYHLGGAQTGDIIRLPLQPTTVKLAFLPENIPSNAGEPTTENKTTQGNETGVKVQIPGTDEFNFPGSESNGAESINKIQNSNLDPQNNATTENDVGIPNPATGLGDDSTKTGREDRELSRSGVSLKSETYTHNANLEEVEEKLKEGKVDDSVIREVLGSLMGLTKVEEIMPHAANTHTGGKARRSISPDKLEKSNLSSKELKMMMSNKPGKQLRKKYRTKRSTYGETSTTNNIPSGQIPELLIPTLNPGIRLSSYEIITNTLKTPQDIPTRSSTEYKYAFRTRPIGRNSIKSTSSFDTPVTRTSGYDTPAIRSSTYDAPVTRSSSYIAPATRSSSFDVKATRSSGYDVPAIRSSSYDAPAIRSSSYDAPATRSSNYAAPATRSSSYDAPAIRSSSYDVPAIRSSNYDVPATRSSNYAAPATRSSSYDAPAIRSSRYDAPVIRSSSYDAPVIRSSSYDAPVIRSSDFEAPATRLSSYDTPRTRPSSYDSTAARSSSYDRPSTRLQKYSTDLSDLPVSRDYPFVRIAASDNSPVRSGYDAGGDRSSYDNPAVREFQTVRMTYEYDTPMKMNSPLASPEIRSVYQAQHVPEGDSNYDMAGDIPDTKSSGYLSDDLSDEPLLEGEDPEPIRISYDNKRRKRSTASKEISKRRVAMVLSTVSRLTRSGPF